MTIEDNRDYVRVLLHSYYTTITGWGVLLNYRLRFSIVAWVLSVECGVLRSGLMVQRSGFWISGFAW